MPADRHSHPIRLQHKTEAEKYLKCNNLQTETQRLWNMKTIVVPIVIGATGLRSKRTCEVIKQIPVSPVHIVQKAM